MSDEILQLKECARHFACTLNDFTAEEIARLVSLKVKVEAKYVGEDPALLNEYPLTDDDGEPINIPVPKPIITWAPIDLLDYLSAMGE